MTGTGVFVGLLKLGAVAVALFSAVFLLGAHL